MSLPDRPLPSLWAVAFATALLAGLTGYFLGQASSIGVFGASSSSPINEKAQVNDPDDPDDEEEVDDDDDHQQDIASFDDLKEECKLVLVVRTDLGMTKGAPHTRRSYLPSFLY